MISPNRDVRLPVHTISIVYVLTQTDAFADIRWFISFLESEFYWLSKLWHYWWGCPIWSVLLVITDQHWLLLHLRTPSGIKNERTTRNSWLACSKFVKSFYWPSAKLRKINGGCCKSQILGCYTPLKSEWSDFVWLVQAQVNRLGTAIPSSSLSFTNSNGEGKKGEGKDEIGGEALAELSPSFTVFLCFYCLFSLAPSQTCPQLSMTMSSKCLLRMESQHYPTQADHWKRKEVRAAADMLSASPFLIFRQIVLHHLLLLPTAVSFFFFIDICNVFFQSCPTVYNLDLHTLSCIFVCACVCISQLPLCHHFIQQSRSKHRLL